MHGLTQTCREAFLMLDVRLAAGGDVRTKDGDFSWPM